MHTLCIRTIYIHLLLLLRRLCRGAMTIPAASTLGQKLKNPRTATNGRPRGAALTRGLTRHPRTPRLSSHPSIPQAFTSSSPS